MDDSGKTRLTRREMLKTAAAGAAATALGASLPMAAGEAAAATGLPMRTLGRTGVKVTVLGLGGQGRLERPSGGPDATAAIINRALDLGINYFDTAPRYGPSQDYYGEAIGARRKDIFLASKTHDRTRDGSLRLLDDSLERMRTDHLDLWQLHNINGRDDLEGIFASDGAIHALTKARDEKMVRYLGITGHFDPDLLIDGLSRFDFDCILMALNAADRHHKSFEAKLLPLAVEKKLGIVGMKVPARGRIFAAYEEGGKGLATMQQALSYTLSLPVATAIVGVDSVAQLEENARIAREFRPLADEEMQRLAEMTAPVGRRASWYKDWSA